MKMVFIIICGQVYYDSMFTQGLAFKKRQLFLSYRCYKVYVTKKALGTWQPGSTKKAVEALDLTDYYVSHMKHVGIYILSPKSPRKSAVILKKNTL